MSIIFENAVNRVNIIPITMKTFATGVVEITVHGSQKKQEAIETDAKENEVAVEALAKDDEGSVEARALALLSPTPCPGNNNAPCQNNCYNDGSIYCKIAKGQKLPGRPPIIIPNLEVGEVDFNLEITYFENKAIKLDLKQIS